MIASDRAAYVQHAVAIKDFDNWTSFSAKKPEQDAAAIGICFARIHSMEIDARFPSGRPNFLFQEPWSAKWTTVLPEADTIASWLHSRSHAKNRGGERVLCHVECAADGYYYFFDLCVLVLSAGGSSVCLC